MAFWDISSFGKLPPIFWFIIKVRNYRRLLAERSGPTDWLRTNPPETGTDHGKNSRKP